MNTYKINHDGKDYDFEYSGHVLKTKLESIETGRCLTCGKCINSSKITLFIVNKLQFDGSKLIKEQRFDKIQEYILPSESCVHKSEETKFTVDYKEPTGKHKHN